MLKAIENKAKESHDGKEYAQKQFEDMKELHQTELRDMESQFLD